MSFSNNGADFRLFLGDELKRLYTEIKNSLDSVEVEEDEEMREGTKAVLERLEKYDISNFTDKDIKKVLKIQKLASEYHDNDN